MDLFYGIISYQLLDSVLVGYQWRIVQLEEGVIHEAASSSVSYKSQIQKLVLLFMQNILKS